MKSRLKIKHLILFSMLFLFRLYAEAQTTVWNQTYAISGSSISGSYSTTNTNGIYTATGEYVYSSRIAKIRITRHNFSGFLTGTNAFQFGNLVNDISINKIQSDAAGNIYVLFQTSTGSASQGDCYLISYTSGLTLRWIRSLNTGTNNQGSDFTLASNGNIYATMTYFSGTNAYLGIKKVNMSTGTIASSFGMGTSTTPYVNRIVTDANGNSYVCGMKFLSAGYSQGFVSRFTNAGINSWTYYHSASTSSTFEDITLDNFGNTIYACGSIKSSSGLYSASVYKFNTSGAVTGNYLFSNSNDNSFLRITRNASGTINVYGMSETTTTASLLVTTLNSSLTSVISTFTSPTGIYASSYVMINTMSIIDHPNGARSISISMVAVFSGNGSPQTYIIRLNASGGVVFSNLLSESSIIHPVYSTTISNTDFITSSNWEYSLTRYIAPPARLEQETITEDINFQPVPNPATNNFRLDGVTENATITIYDMNGKMIIRTNYQPGEPIDVSGWNKGLYLLNIETAEGMISRKVLVE